MQTTTRPRSIYVFDCLCGREISSETVNVECPWCHREIRLIWPAEQTNLESMKKEKDLIR
jgi:hypothetical protein